MGFVHLEHFSGEITCGECMGTLHVTLACDCLCQSAFSCNLEDVNILVKPSRRREADPASLQSQKHWRQDRQCPGGQKEWSGDLQEYMLLCMVTWWLTLLMAVFSSSVTKCSEKGRNAEDQISNAAAMWGEKRWSLRGRVNWDSYLAIIQ